jgi:hypothetical protein
MQSSLIVIAIVSTPRCSGAGIGRPCPFVQKPILVLIGVIHQILSHFQQGRQLPGDYAGKP